MGNKKFIRNIIMDIILHAILIYRIFDMDNTLINNVCKFLPAYFSILFLVTMFAFITFCAAINSREMQARILSDKDFTEEFIKLENNKKIGIYHKITNCSLAGLLICNGFAGALTLYLLALMSLTFSKQALKTLISLNTPPKPDPMAFERYKQKLYQETSNN